MVGALLARLRGVGGCDGVKSGLERVMVLVKRGAWFLRMACFRAGWLPLLLGCLLSCCHCYWAA